MVHTPLTTRAFSSTGKRKRVDDEELSAEAGNAADKLAVASSSTSTQTVAPAAQVQTSVQTLPASVDAVAEAPLVPAVPEERPRKKARSFGTFLLGALAGSVATVGALAAYGWNEEMAGESGGAW